MLICASLKGWAVDNGNGNGDSRSSSPAGISDADARGTNDRTNNDRMTVPHFHHGFVSMSSWLSCGATRDGIAGHHAEVAWRLLYDAMIDRVLSSFYWKNRRPLQNNITLWYRKSLYDGYYLGMPGIITGSQNH